jgi:hypothetical protein
MMADELTACRRALFLIELATMSLDHMQMAYTTVEAEKPTDRSAQVANGQTLMLIDHIGRYRFGNRWLR